MEEPILQSEIAKKSTSNKIKRAKLNKALKPLYFIFPALLIYVFVIVIPTIYTLVLSFFEWNGVATAEKIFVGVSNYINLFKNDSVFNTALINNIIWTILSLVFAMGFALLLAMMLNKSFKGRALFRAVFYFPYILSNIVVAMIWVWLYHPNIGLINDILSIFGIENVGWLSNPNLALYSVFIASTWQFVGSAMVIYLAGLQTIPSEQYEAAEIDGASKFQTFINITLPLLRETNIIVFATTLFYSMRIFDIIFAMTGGGPSQSTQVLASWMYYQSFQMNNIGTGSAISIILLLLVMIVAIPYILWQSKKSHV